MRRELVGPTVSLGRVVCRFGFTASSRFGFCYGRRLNTTPVRVEGDGGSSGVDALPWLMSFVHGLMVDFFFLLRGFMFGGWRSVAYARVRCL